MLLKRSGRALLILAVIAFGLVPAPASAAPVLITPSPSTAANTGNVTVTISGSGLDEVTKAQLFIPLSEEASVPGNVNCKDGTSAATDRCLHGTVDALTRTASSVQVTWNVFNVAPSDEWRIQLIDERPAPTGGTTECVAGCMTITAAAPTITGVIPSSRGQGAQAASVEISGTNIFPGVRVLAAAGVTGVSVANVLRIANTKVAAEVTLTEDATVGNNSLRIVNTDDQEIDVPFEILQGPKITTLTPSTRGRASVTTVNVTGTGFSPSGPSTFAVSPATDVSISDVVISSATAASFKLTIDAIAATGSRTVSITNPGDGGRGTASFVIAPDPVVTSVSPDIIRTNAQNKAMTINGSDFASGAEVSFSPAVIALDGNPTVSSTQISAVVDVVLGTSPQVVQVLVSNGDGGPVAKGEIEVADAPTIESATSKLGQGAVDHVYTILGSGLSANATIDLGAGVTFSTCAKIVGFSANPAQASRGLECEVDVDAAAATGARTLTVTNPGDTPVSRTNATTITAAPTATTVSPTSRGAGSQAETIVFTGTGFSGSVNVEFGNPGISILSRSVSPTQLTTVIAITEDAAVGALDPVIVNGDGGRGSCACQFTVNTGPTLSSVAPEYVGRSTTVAATFTGTDFDTSSMTFDLGNDVTLANVTPVDATSYTADITVEADAVTGGRDVVAIAPDGGRGTCVGCFTPTIPPTISSITPSYAEAGATGAAAVIEGEGFLTGATVSLGAGITVTETTKVGDTLEVVFNVASSAIVGVRNVSVSNPDASTVICQSCFEVTSTPTFTSFDPQEVGRGAVSAPVTVMGTGFRDGATVVSGTETTVTEVTYVSTTKIIFKLSVNEDAALGERDVTISNPNGGASASCIAAEHDCISIGTAPTLTSISPSTVGAGRVGTFQLTGSGFNANTFADFGADAVTNSTTFISTTRIDVNATIGEGTSLGARDVFVVGGNLGRGKLIGGLTVSAGPVVSSVSPNSIDKGQTATLRVTGTGFATSVTADFGSGVIVNSVTRVNSTALDVNVTADAGAADGFRDIVITNVADGGRGSCLECVSVGTVDLSPVFSATGYLNEGFKVSFGARVREVTSSNMALRLTGSSANLSGTIVCHSLAEAVRDCATDTDIRSATFTPTSTLVPGQRYTAHINPSSAATVIRTDSTSQAIPNSTRDFRGLRWIENHADAFTYSWQIVKDSAAMGGKYVRESLAGGRAIYSFSGDSVKWHTFTGPDEGVAAVSVDGTLVQIVDNSSSSPRAAITRTFSGFGPGTHSLRFYVRGQKGSAGGKAFVSIDALEDTSLKTNPKGTFKWSLRSGEAWGSSTVSRAGIGSQTAFFSFRGQTLDIYAIEGQKQGKVNIYIDGRWKGTFSLYSGSDAVRQLRIGGLTDQVHRLKILILGTKVSASKGTQFTFDRVRVT